MKDMEAAAHLRWYSASLSCCVIAYLVMARKALEAEERSHWSLDPMAAVEALYLYHTKQKVSGPFLFLKSRGNLVFEGADLDLQLCCCARCYYLTK